MRMFPQSGVRIEKLANSIANNYLNINTWLRLCIPSIHGYATI